MSRLIKHATRISLQFNHPGCPDDVVVDIYLPLPDKESTEAMAARVLPLCPICKQPMRYVGWNLDTDEGADA